ncbi:hypothetical protein DR864_25480 [Runella rosea]|uniref:WD40-like Beta Propeller Repeat n=1 Tax=Runella rosea TaxID=2259595 RepID=A0A344TQC6_9BACT|nr:hypothetical protein [Runella rosea]AXE20847.1 hypothetical protein DR864_25480 [Runella rosea]
MTRMVISFIMLVMISCRSKGDLNPQGRQTVYPDYISVTGNSGQPVSLNWIIGKSKACGWECWGDTTTYNYYQPDYYDIYLSTENGSSFTKTYTVKGDLNGSDLALPDNRTYYIRVKAIYTKLQLEISSNIIILSGDSVRQSEIFPFVGQIYTIEKDGDQYMATHNEPLFNKVHSKVVLTGSSKSGKWANWIQDVKTGEQRFIWKTTIPAFGKISPDGKKVLLKVSEINAGRADSHNLHLFDTQTNQFTALTNWKKTISNVVWSPTSDFCSTVFYESPAGEITLATINIVTSKITILRQENLGSFNSLSLLDWLESDSKIYFSEIRNFPEANAKMTLFTIGKEGDKLTKITDFENTTYWYEYSHTYNPTAEKLVFTSRRSGKTGMWVKDIKHNREYQIVNSLTDSYTLLGWKSDNELVYQIISSDGKTNYYSLNVP